MCPPKTALGGNWSLIPPPGRDQPHTQQGVISWGQKNPGPKGLNTPARKEIRWGAPETNTKPGKKPGVSSTWGPFTHVNPGKKRGFPKEEIPFGGKKIAPLNPPGDFHRKGWTPIRENLPVLQVADALEDSPPREWIAFPQHFSAPSYDMMDMVMDSCGIWFLMKGSHFGPIIVPFFKAVSGN